jgi:hypothetical protein
MEAVDATFTPRLEESTRDSTDVSETELRKLFVPTPLRNEKDPVPVTEPVEEMDAERCSPVARLLYWSLASTVTTIGLSTVPLGMARNTKRVETPEVHENKQRREATNQGQSSQVSLRSLKALSLVEHYPELQM